MDDAALRDEATRVTAELIRLDTSNPPGRETPAAAFLKDYLEGHGIHCELVARTPERANLVARIPGTGGGPSLALTGHTDVVPADARDWRHPPFSGHVDDDGYLWGRGTVDMKGQTATSAVAMAVLAREGFRPRGDLVFIAQADEEVGVDVGMSWLVRERPDLRVDYAIDEGGGDRLQLADGRIVVPIGVAEKACYPALVTALGEAGHASTPTVGANAVPRLAMLIGRLAAYQPARTLLPVTDRMLAALGAPDGELDDRIARAAAAYPTLEHVLPALFQPTLAPTRIYGSDARNVMPARATVDVDCRLLPGTGERELAADLRAALGDDIPYEISYPQAVEGGSMSDLDTPLYAACSSYLAATDPDAVLLPMMSTGFVDSYWLRSAWNTTCYGFWPVRHTPNEVLSAGVHNRDERILVDDLLYATRFLLHAARAMA